MNLQVHTLSPMSAPKTYIFFLSHNNNYIASLLLLLSTVLKEEIATAQKNIKAKNKGKNVKFVIDKEGKLITVDPVRPEGLPPFAMPINPNISPEGNDENNDGKRRGKGRKSIRVPGAVSVPLEDLYFKAANTLATTLAGGEQIKEIQPGVSIQAGENVRMGPESLALPNKQTRKEYLRGSTNQMGSYMDGLGSSLDSPGSLFVPINNII